MPQADETLQRNTPVIMEHMIQGTDEWIQARVGRITMSNAQALITGGKGKTRDSYLIKVASEIATGRPSEQISTWHMERGILLEPYAREAYKEETGIEVREIGLAYLDDRKRIAASPDGLTKHGGVEIKCQMPKNHLQTMIDAMNPKLFEAQMQGGMWVTGAESWDYVSYCPEFKERPIFIIRKIRDEEIIKSIEESALHGLEEIDDYVNKFTRGVPSEKMLDIRRRALEMLDVMQDKEPGIY